MKASSLTRNNVQISGAPSGPTMVFANGFGCDQTVWRFIVPAFEKHFRIVRFDHVGSGRSDVHSYNPIKYSRLQGYADDLNEILLDLEIRSCIFVGHSVSTMIGLLAAIEQPQNYSQMILVGPSPRYIDDENYIGGFTLPAIESLLEFLDRNYLGWSSQIAPLIMGNPDRPELAAELTYLFCQNDPDILRQFARVTFLGDNRADLPKMKIPSLVLQCSEDIIAPEPVGQYVHQHLPHSEYVLLQATGHCPILSAPEETASAIQSYLKRVLPLSRAQSFASFP